MSANDVRQQEVVARSETSPAYSAARETVARLAQLPQNWDTYGSRPIQRDAVQGAVCLIELAEQMGLPAPYISPVSGGGLQLEWCLRERGLELEVLPDGSVEYLRLEDGEPGDEGAIASCHQSAIDVHLRWLKLQRDGDR